MELLNRHHNIQVQSSFITHFVVLLAKHDIDVSMYKSLDYPILKELGITSLKHQIMIVKKVFRNSRNFNSLFLDNRALGPQKCVTELLGNKLHSLSDGSALPLLLVTLIRTISNSKPVRSTLMSNVMIRMYVNQTIFFTNSDCLQ